MNLDNPITRILVLCACVSRASHHYNFPIEVQLWDARRTPLDQMVDVTNQFGLKVLYEHNFLNQNNVAFSPYGLTGILMALFEGVEGESSYQIQRCMELPWNRDVLRIGFRDIHRTLKTYFIPEEGFLAGLALNNENVTFKEEYRNILRFYGFNLETDRLPSTTSASTPHVSESTTNSNKEETTPTPAPSENSSMEPREPTSSATTASPLVSTLQTTILSTQAVTTVASDTVADSVASSPNGPTTTVAVVIPSTNSPVETTIPIAEMTSGLQSVTPVEETESAAAEETTVTPMTIPTIPVETSLPSTVITVTETSPNPADAETTSVTTTSSPVNVGEITSETPRSMPTIMAISTNADATISQVTSTTAQLLPTNTPDTTTVTTAASTVPSAATAPSEVPETGTMTTINSDVELLTSSGDINMVTTISSNGTPSPSTTLTSVPTTASSGTAASPISPTETPPATTNAEPVTTLSPDIPTPFMTAETATAGLETLERRKRSILNFIMERPLGYEEYLNAPLDFQSGIHPKYSGQTMFLANGLKNVEVSYMVYDTVLEYTYLPHFKASAIKLPLDNDHYYLLVVLPDYEFDLNRLTKRLALESNLRDIYSALQPRYVQACVPSFMVKGFVTLTPDLQRLGIRDVFEPRQNDFSPMTNQKGVYVRNVEQSITVTIRKYQNKTSQKSSRPVSSNSTIHEHHARSSHRPPQPYLREKGDPDQTSPYKQDLKAMHYSSSNTKFSVSIIAILHEQVVTIDKKQRRTISRRDFLQPTIGMFELRKHRRVVGRYVLNRHPVYFSATYPFLYFVMDSNIHVSLMAGKLMDPLNTRVI